MGRSFNLMREQADYFHLGPNVVQQFHEFPPGDARLSLDIDYLLCSILRDCSEPGTDFSCSHGWSCVQLCPVTPDCGGNKDSAVAAGLGCRSYVEKEVLNGVALLAMGGRTQRQQQDRHSRGWAQHHSCFIRHLDSRRVPGWLPICLHGPLGLAGHISQGTSGRSRRE